MHNFCNFFGLIRRLTIGFALLFINLPHCWSEALHVSEIYTVLGHLRPLGFYDGMTYSSRPPF